MQCEQIKAADAVEFEARMEYVGNGDNAIALWCLLPHSPVARDTAVLICPPLGSEFVRSYRSLRRLGGRIGSLSIGFADTPI